MEQEKLQEKEAEEIPEGFRKCKYTFITSKLWEIKCLTCEGKASLAFNQTDGDVLAVLCENCGIEQHLPSGNEHRARQRT